MAYMMARMIWRIYMAHIWRIYMAQMMHGVYPRRSWVASVAASGVPQLQPIDTLKLLVEFARCRECTFSSCICLCVYWCAHASTVALIEHALKASTVALVVHAPKGLNCGIEGVRMLNIVVRASQ
eukprot:1138418-Pelagomonas_calceolata.AAC.1